MGSKCHNMFLSVRNHVAYQIKGNEPQSTIQGHSLSLRTSSTTGSKLFFLNEVMLHIKLMGMGHRAPCKHTSCPYIQPHPLGLAQKVKIFFFLKVVMLHIKLKGIKHRAPCTRIFLSLHTPLAPRWCQKVKICFSLYLIVLHFNLKGI